MREWKKAAMRRQRALTIAKVSLERKALPPRHRRRKITECIRAACAQKSPTVWECKPVAGLMGTVFDRPIYSGHCLPGNPFALPFDAQPFVCLIHASMHISDEHFKALALGLLQQKMRLALCSGIESERLSDLLTTFSRTGSFMTRAERPWPPRSTTIPSRR
jgi:hypothetical protein